ncbi:uncharacterized protein CCDC198-like [Sipha flava]|uniref:Uncharacterized protein CCDC198-like n=1 Tax=Sipha flava TaxID=143950 RepID=A0A2S2Q984_9HEMI|nr:uncharacterized protein CCDC198-like [Sipha flava]
MGCGGSTMPMPMPNEELSKLRLEIPSPIAFSVPLTEEEESLVKRHPPKRFRMLEGQKSPPLTSEALQEKLAEAEQRRQQILNQRIESAKTLMRPRYNSTTNQVNVDEKLTEDEEVKDEES